jgi:hypothetical protein
VAFADYLCASGASLLAHRGPPSLKAAESALDAYLCRRDRPRSVARVSLPGDAAERVFALGFALEQMHDNFKDLQRCMAEWAGTFKEAGRKRSI